MAHHVADEHACGGAGQGDHVKEITANKARWVIDTEKTQGAFARRRIGRETGKVMRQHRQLQLVGDLQLRLH